MKFTLPAYLRTFAFIMSIFIASFARAEVVLPAQIVPVIGDELFDQILIVRGATSESSTQVKYMTEQDSEADWKQRISYAYVNEDGMETPKDMASKLVDSLQSVNPGAKYSANASANGDVIILDFIVTPPGANYMEFTAFRIQTIEGRLYSIQMTSRMPKVAEPTPESLKPLTDKRKLWLATLVKSDMKKIAAMLDTVRNLPEE